MTALSFATTRAFRPLIDGKPGIPLIAVEHWNGFDKLIDSAGRFLIVKFTHADSPLTEAMRDILNLGSEDFGGGTQAIVVAGTPALLSELALVKAAG